MQFVALIYSTEGQDDVDWETLIDQYGQFSNEAGAAGTITGGYVLPAIS